MQFFEDTAVAAKDASTSTLKPQFRDKKPCQYAAHLRYAELGADAMDFEHTQATTGTFSTLAMMKCLDWSVQQIVFYYVLKYTALLVLTFRITNKIYTSLPERVQQNANCKPLFAAKRKGVAATKPARKTTPAECRRQIQILVLLLSFTVAFIIVAIVNSIFRWHLRLKIFNTEALMGQALVSWLV